MAEYLPYVLLGLVQGVTEFLPISSDGHLVIVSRWLETPGDGLALVVLLHLGSLGAVLWAFRRDLLGILRPRGPRPEAGEAGGERDPRPSGPRLLGLLAIATLPVVIVGPLLHDRFVSAFESVPLAAAMLMTTGAILLATRALRTGNAMPGRRSAFAMGCAQVLALLPGLSRSAVTLATGFAMGLDRVQAARFSFLMSVPAIAGANLYELATLGGARGVDGPGVLIGIAAAFLSGLIAIRALLALVPRGRFEWFGLYCLAAGLLLIALD